MSLKANVGLSRKLSKDYNSTGFSLNLEGEILATPDDPDAVVERIRELYAIAEEALDRQINESQGTDALAARDAEETGRKGSNGHGQTRPEHMPDRPSTGHNGGSRSPHDTPATNKQIQFLQTLAKRSKLFGPRLEGFIQEVVGHRCSPYDLTKAEAGRVIDQLAGEETGSPSRR